MIKKIHVTNSNNSTLSLELSRPELTGIIVTNIGGLGPVKANINQTELATVDGARKNSARLGARNITLSLRYEQYTDLGLTVEEIRRMTYSYFAPKDEIELVIETDADERDPLYRVRIIGTVESNEPNIFSKVESATISILCDDPRFHSILTSRAVFKSYEPLFEFPFDGNHTDDTLIFGNVYNEIEGSLYNYGENGEGFEMTIELFGPATNLTIVNTNTEQRMTINDDKLESILGSGLRLGDRIIINTKKGNKIIQIIRSGQIYNLLNALEMPVQWITLNNGENYFLFLADTGIENINFYINNDTTFDGI